MAIPLISARLDALLEQSLYAIADSKDAQRARAALRDVGEYVTSLRQQSSAEVDENSFFLGAAEMVKTLLIRVIDRKEGNRALDFVRRRKHVKDMLHIMAAKTGPVMPSELALRLGVPQPTVTTLLKCAESFSLVRTELNPQDGRNRPRRITDLGEVALTAVLPEWPLEDPVARQTSAKENKAILGVVKLSGKSFDNNLLGRSAPPARPKYQIYRDTIPMYGGQFAVNAYAKSAGEVPDFVFDVHPAVNEFAVGRRQYG